MPDTREIVQKRKEALAEKTRQREIAEINGYVNYLTPKIGKGEADTRKSFRPDYVHKEMSRGYFPHEIIFDIYIPPKYIKTVYNKIKQQDREERLFGKKLYTGIDLPGEFDKPLPRQKGLKDYLGPTGSKERQNIEKAQQEHLEDSAGGKERLEDLEKTVPKERPEGKEEKKPKEEIPGAEDLKGERVKKPTGKMAEKAEEELKDKVGKKAVGEIGKQAGKKVGEEIGKKVGEKATEEVAKKAGAAMASGQWWVAIAIQLGDKIRKSKFVKEIVVVFKWLAISLGVGAMVVAFVLGFSMAYVLFESTYLGRSIVASVRSAVKLYRDPAQWVKELNFSASVSKNSIIYNMTLLGAKAGVYLGENINKLRDRIKNDRLITEKQKNEAQTKLDEIKQKKEDLDKTLEKLAPLQEKTNTELKEEERKEKRELKEQSINIYNELYNQITEMYQNLYKCDMAEASGEVTEAGRMKIPNNIGRIYATDTDKEKSKYTHSYANPRTICLIIQMDKWWNDTYSNSSAVAEAKARNLLIGHMSLPKGESGIHEELYNTGEDAQIWVPCATIDESYNHGCKYNRDVARAFAKQIIELAGSDATIIFGDEELAKEYKEVEYNHEYTAYWVVHIPSS